ncbi:SNF2 family N-terminal domain-containing protein [Mucor mucedo]|uniref:SNF2 family N-terminal domain-containing protein n=1 Tax=Mucor mucedo TaxID=29922 RepID=UPI0022206645|nr:SNF2 family N-terminal domain-containing protein [Mucor mucedo]KAI7897119.1 SNF2 family N-terminal domain-containing protein [Mucor mucedo]
MNQDCFPSQKPNSGRSSASMTETAKRRRLVETPLNNMFRPTPGQSALIQNRLASILRTDSPPTPPQSASKEESPTPYLGNLKIEEDKPKIEQVQQQGELKEKTRQELYAEQLRLREESKRRQKATAEQARQLEIVKAEEKVVLLRQQKLEEMGVKPDPDVKPQPSPNPKPAVKVESDDDIIIDEEMTNKNICIGMVNTDIVVEKAPLNLIRDEQFEIVSLESEGKLSDNYSFKVTSRSQPPQFYGWVPFKDTKVLGPLVDHRLIWWDAVIPRGKATAARTPICIILYCRPDLLGTIGKYFESQRLYLKNPPFYNPACRYSNPHYMLDQSHYHHLHQQQQHQQHNHHQQISHQSNQQQHHYQYQRQSYHDYGGPHYRYDLPYTTHHQYTTGNPTNQGQKDIEMLLASIPSDVPQILLKKRKNKKKSGVIEILTDDSMDESDKEEETLDNGYVEGLKCHLMDHQIKGVSWMIDRENNQSSNGGILADMGLGKTIQTIALMASTMTSEDDRESGDPDHQITLIVTPLALVHQWVEEIISKTDKGKLRVLKHHGPNRARNPAVFKHYDVVVTTYQVVASDMPGDERKGRKKKRKDSFVVDDDDEEEVLKDGAKSDTESDAKSDAKAEEKAEAKPVTKKDYGPLFQIDWHRIVLDEAQFIKNRMTKASLSCATLKAAKRWCLTGTPIQNNVDELYSLLRFLRIQPLSDYPTFKKTISIPIMNGDTAIAMNRLKAVLMAVMLRRTKSVLGSSTATQDANGQETQQTEESDENSSLSKKLTLKLPTREKSDLLLQFSDHERALYELLMKRSKEAIDSMTGNQSRYMNMLCLLLRLRQACDHPQLILNAIDSDKDVLDIVSDAGNVSDSMYPKLCELCGRSNNGQTVDNTTPYCDDCIKVIKQSDGKEGHHGLFKTSTKIRKLMEILMETRDKNPGEKTIVFSQFTSMLDLVEGPLRRNGFAVCRYDGSMSSQLREKSLHMLKHDKKVTVMLISLKCGSLGLNLTAANRVILMDIWWNPALEEQAIDRVHRIGQRLPVHVTRLLIDNTVELKIVELQEKKAQLSKGALGDGLVKSAKLSASEIRSLFFNL